METILAVLVRPAWSPDGAGGLTMKRRWRNVKKKFQIINFVEIHPLLMIYILLERRGGILPKHAGAYKGEKRRKELSRQKKQEERRQRRFHKGDPVPSDAGKVEEEETKPADS